MESQPADGLPDWRTWEPGVYMIYEDGGNDSDEAERYYPHIRRPKDAEPKLSCEEELHLMEKQVEESQGFDIDFAKFRCLFNYLPVPLYSEYEFEFIWTENTRNVMNSISREALNGFNEKYSTEYEFVKVIKANYHTVSGFMFFITFEAKLHSHDCSKDFQAKVYYDCSGSHVISCEL